MQNSFEKYLQKKKEKYLQKKKEKYLQKKKRKIYTMLVITKLLLIKAPDRELVK